MQLLGHATHGQPFTEKAHRLGWRRSQRVQEFGLAGKAPGGILQVSYNQHVLPNNLRSDLHKLECLGHVLEPEVLDGRRSILTSDLKRHQADHGSQKELGRMSGSACCGGGGSWLMTKVGTEDSRLLMAVERGQLPHKEGKGSCLRQELVDDNLRRSGCQKLQPSCTEGDPLISRLGQCL